MHRGRWARTNSDLPPFNKVPDSIQSCPDLLEPEFVVQSWWEEYDIETGGVSCWFVNFGEEGSIFVPSLHDNEFACIYGYYVALLNLFLAVVGRLANCAIG